MGPDVALGMKRGVLHRDFQLAGGDDRLEQRLEGRPVDGSTGRPYIEAGANGKMSDDPQTIRVYQSALYLLDVMHRVPVHVIPCIEGRPDGPATMSGVSFYGSIMQAAWSFMLALRARGLGSVWTTLHLSREQDAAELLGIPYESVTQVALLPVAYTIGTEFKPAARGPVEEITFWDEWGASG